MDYLGGASIVDGELDGFTSLPDVHQSCKRARNDRRVIISKHAVESIDQVRCLDKLSVMIVELGYSESRGLANVWILVFEQYLYRWDSGFDKFADVDVRHGTEGEGSYQGI